MRARARLPFSHFLRAAENASLSHPLADAHGEEGWFWLSRIPSALQPKGDLIELALCVRSKEKEREREHQHQLHNVV